MSSATAESDSLVISITQSRLIPLNDQSNLNEEIKSLSLNNKDRNKLLESTIIYDGPRPPLKSKNNNNNTNHNHNDNKNQKNDKADDDDNNKVNEGSKVDEEFESFCLKFEEWARKFLSNFPFDLFHSEVIFPSAFNSKQRAIIHNISKELGFCSSSSGFGLKRSISVFNQKLFNDPNYISIVYRYGHIYIEGPFIDNLANKFIQDNGKKINQNFLEKRVQRDGEHFHITLIHKNNLSQAINYYFKSFNEDQQAVIPLLLDLFTKNVDYKEMKAPGVGSIESKVYFVVIKWDSANQFRNLFGLPSVDLHITLGFEGDDIHDHPKDESTLVLYDNNYLVNEMDRYKEMARTSTEALHKIELSLLEADLFKYFTAFLGGYDSFRQLKPKECKEIENKPQRLSPSLEKKFASRIRLFPLKNNDGSGEIPEVTEESNETTDSTTRQGSPSPSSTPPNRSSTSTPENPTDNSKPDTPDEILAMCSTYGVYNREEFLRVRKIMESKSERDVLGHPGGFDSRESANSSDRAVAFVTKIPKLLTKIDQAVAHPLISPDNLDRFQYLKVMIAKLTPYAQQEYSKATRP